MKIGHIMCKSLCIYVSQVPACVKGGRGSINSGGIANKLAPIYAPHSTHTAHVMQS